MKFLDTVKNYLSQYNISSEDAREILLDIEKEVGHNPNLIRAVVDTEREGLMRRLKRKKKQTEISYV